MVPDGNTKIYKIAGRYILYRETLWQMQKLKSIIHTVQTEKFLMRP